MHHGCAPVANFALTIAGDRIVGHAAPAAGPLPCMLRLEADGEPIAIGRATHFSATAAAHGIRHGWCGVEMGGLGMADALADRASVVCVASGMILLETDIPSIAIMPPAAFSAADLIAYTRQGEVCTDISTILPFAEASLHRHGVAGLIDAAYRSLLLRPAEDAVITAWLAVDPPAGLASILLEALLETPEYLDRPGHLVPGPFHPAFAFDLSPLDEPPVSP